VIILTPRLLAVSTQTLAVGWFQLGHRRRLGWPSNWSCILHAGHRRRPSELCRVKGCLFLTLTDVLLETNAFIAKPVRNLNMQRIMSIQLNVTKCKCNHNQVLNIGSRDQGLVCLKGSGISVSHGQMQYKWINPAVSVLHLILNFFVRFSLEPNSSELTVSTSAKWPTEKTSL